MTIRSITLGCCLNKELVGLVRREFSNKGNARLLFSPTWESVTAFLKKNLVSQVIVSSTISETLLKDLAAITNSQTSFIILGSKDTAQKLIRGTSGYFFKRREPYELIQTRIKSLGADVRNDLNNPLQEIVALAYVAKQTTNDNAATGGVFEALENAAMRMHSVVSTVEDRIVSNFCQ